MVLHGIVWFGMCACTHAHTHVLAYDFVHIYRIYALIYEAIYLHAHIGSLHRSLARSRFNRNPLKNLGHVVRHLSACSLQDLTLIAVPSSCVGAELNAATEN